MSGYDDLTSDSCWPDRTDRAGIEDSAVLAVLHRVDQGQLSHADAHTVLQVLGLVDEASQETRLPSAAAQARRRRRATERDRKREEGAA